MVECGECGREFDTEKGLKIHRTHIHVDRSSQGSPLPPAKDRTPPIIQYEVSAGVEVADGFFQKALECDNESEREYYMRRGRMELQTVKNTVE